MLLACVGLSSCIDNFDEDEKIAYPAKAPVLGAWGHVAATADDFDYTLNMVVDAAGDTVVTVQTLMGDGSAITTLGTVTEYDPVSGTLVAEGQSEFGYYLFGQVMPARIFVNYNNALNGVSVSISLVNGSNAYDAQYYIGAGSFNAVKFNKPLEACGTFQSVDGNITLMLFGDDADVKQQMGYTGEGYIGALYVGEGQDIVLYEYDKATGTLTMTSLFDSETHYSATFNEKAELVFQAGETPIVLEQVF